MINGMLNTIEILIHITLERKTKKIILIDNSDEEEGNKKRNMRKRKNVQTVDEMNEKSQVLVPRTEPKENRKAKVKVEIKTETKPLKLPKKEKVKTRKRKRKNEINIDEVSKKPKKTEEAIQKNFQ